MIAMWGPKGGQGVSVTVAALALAQLQRHHGTVAIVDLAGDQPAVLGTTAQHSVGVLDWLGGDAPASALRRTVLPVTESLTVVPLGGAVTATGGVPGYSEARVGDLWRAVESLADMVLVDAGVPGSPGEFTGGQTSTAWLRRLAVEASDTNLVVVRACYLALRRFRGLGLSCDSAVLVHEAQRALGKGDVADALGVPVATTVDHDPAVARSVDAGLLATRVPRRLDRAMGSLAGVLVTRVPEPGRVDRAPSPVTSAAPASR